MENEIGDADSGSIRCVNSLENALEVVKDYELRTTTKFTVYKRSKDFGATGKPV